MKEELGDFIEASGLLSYDPESITKIYRKYPDVGDNYKKITLTLDR